MQKIVNGYLYNRAQCYIKPWKIENESILYIFKNESML